MKPIPNIKTEPAPVDSLVERLARAIHPSICADLNLYQHEARAAIREVAAWLRENDANCSMGGDAAATADLLDEEVNLREDHARAQQWPAGGAVMEKPKIVQIASLPESENFLPVLYALDSDGSIWIRNYPNHGVPEVWQRIPSPFDKEEAQ